MKLTACMIAVALLLSGCGTALWWDSGAAPVDPRQEIYSKGGGDAFD